MLYFISTKNWVKYKTFTFTCTNTKARLEGEIFELSSCPDNTN